MARDVTDGGESGALVETEEISCFHFNGIIGSLGRDGEISVIAETLKVCGRNGSEKAFSGEDVLKSSESPPDVIAVVYQQRCSVL